MPICGVVVGLGDLVAPPSAAICVPCVAPLAFPEPGAAKTNQTSASETVAARVTAAAKGRKEVSLRRGGVGERLGVVLTGRPLVPCGP